MFRRCIGVGACALAGTTYVHWVEPFWLQVHELPMPVRNLPSAFAGYRIAHMSDLHARDATSMAYLARTVDRVNALRPDLVVLTGDLVTHNRQWVEPITRLLGTLRAPLLVSFGNHDYDEASSMYIGDTALAENLQAHLTARGATVLRNRAVPITVGKDRIWIVGLEDLWSGRFSPQVALAGLDVREPIIALSHNPDTAPALDAYGVQWTLSGHTHGGQVRLPFIGAPLLNIENRNFQQGLVRLANGHLYVTRGIGYLARIRFMCRPELPCFTLCGA